MSSKKISFSVPEYLYTGIKNTMESLGIGDFRVEDFFKACAINKMIEKGYLNEFGEPNILFGKLDFSKVDMPSWSELSTSSKTGFDVNELRSITIGK